jgi:hypothetical protein
MHSIPHLVGSCSMSAGSVFADLVTYRMQQLCLASRRHKDADTQCHQSSLSRTPVMTELGNVMVPHRSVSSLCMDAKPNWDWLWPSPLYRSRLTAPNNHGWAVCCFALTEVTHVALTQAASTGATVGMTSIPCVSRHDISFAD